MELRRGARREGNECISSMRAEMVEVECLAVFTDGKIDGTAADCAADLPISRALAAILVMRQCVIRALRLSGDNVRNAVRQAAHPREQQGKGEQQWIENAAAKPHGRETIAKGRSNCKNKHFRYLTCI